MSRILHAISSYLADYALFWPGVAVSIALAAGFSAPLARRLPAARAVAALLVFGIGLIVAATLMPSREALLFGAQGRATCDLSRIGLAPLGDVLHLRDAAFNLGLFLPFGLAVGAIPRRRARLVLVALGVALPPAIELTQLVVRPLGRACQSADVIDNWTGFAVGLAVGSILAWVVGAAEVGATSADERSGDRREDGPGDPGSV